MLWSFRRWRDRRRAAEKMRAEHEAFLSTAILHPGAYPRIPTRRSDAGGFGPMIERPGGRARAERWWSLAMDRVERR